MGVLRWLLKPIHTRLERYCCRRVGYAHCHFRDKGFVDPTVTRRFKWASRLEWKLRHFCYPGSRRV